MQTALPPGTVLHSRYRIVGVAGQGHFGQTYLARDEKQLDDLCVVKEFIPSVQDPAKLREQWQSIEQAVSILYDLQHPQLPRFQLLVAQGPRFYWVREYIEGKSFSILLDERLAYGRSFSEPEVIHVLLQVLPVLGYLHSQGILHQAISPECIILRQSDQMPVLINFGLVKDLVARLQLHPVDWNATIKHWGYAPPEQLYGGKLLPSSDLYALGVTAIALLTGQEAEDLYEPQTQTINWSKIVVSPAFGQVLRQLLNPHPLQRFTSALQVMQALHTLSSVSAPTPTGVTPAPPSAPPPSEPPLQRTLAKPVPSQNRGSAQAAVQPPAKQPPPQSPNSSPKAKTPPKRGVRFRVSADLLATAALVIGMSMLVAVVAWRVVFYGRVDRSLAPTTATTSPAPVVSPSSSSPTASPTPSVSPSSDVIDPTALRDRRRNLGIDYAFFTGLVDEVFYAQHPDLKDRNLGNGTDQGKLQTEWNTIANTLMDKLETLTPQTRGRLGTYRRETYDQWLAQLGGNQQTLDSLADTRFYELFPDLKGKTLNPQTFGQIWYAIAEEQVEAARATPAPSQPAPSPTAEQGDINRSL